MNEDEKSNTEKLLEFKLKQYKLKDQLTKVKSQLNGNKSKSSKFNVNISNDQDMNDE